MQSTPHKTKRILISPLNWGLGHATRLLPVIHKLIKDGHQCMIAGESPSVDVIKEAFPHLLYISTRGFSIQLSGNNNQLTAFITHLPALLSSIKDDSRQADDLVRKHHIDLIISDNRYGFHSPLVKSIIITHQTNPQTGLSTSWTRPIVKRIVKKWLSPFDSCWIPDITGHKNLSGRLSAQTLHPSSHHIGILSRLSLSAFPGTPVESPHILVILSGPEPHRSLFEKQIIERFQNSMFKITILQGQPHLGIHMVQKKNITFISHCDITTFQNLLTNSRLIICRSGYSTLMDLFYAGRRAILIPTPGQYEQIYLARRMNRHFGFTSIEQHQILSSAALADDHMNISNEPLNVNFNICNLPKI